MLAIKLAIRNLLGAGLRTWLNVFVLSLSYVMIIYMNGMLDGWNSQAKSDMRVWETGGSQYWHTEYDPFDAFTIEDSHANIPVDFNKGIAAGDFAPVLITTASIFPEGRVQSVLLKGISINQNVVQLPSTSMLGEWDDIPAIIGKRMAEKNKLKKGDLLTIRWRDVDGTFDARDVVITEIFSCNVPSIDAGQVWIPLNTLQEMMQVANEATIIISSSEDDLDILSAEFVYKNFEFLTEEVTKIIQAKSVGTSIFYVILLLLAMLAIFDTQVLSIFRRQREIGTQIALGMTRGQVVRLFTIEGAMHAVLAAGLGAIYGIPLLLSQAKNGIPMPEGTEDFGMAISDTIIPEYSIGLIVGTIIAVLLAATIVSYIPARKISKMKPTDAIRGKVQ